MELSGGVKQRRNQIEISRSTHVVALTTKGPNVTVLAHAESPIGAPALGSPH